VEFHATEVDKISWNSMEFHGKIHGIPWNFMEFHGIHGIS
jgi:hypothetical protein